MAGTLSRIEIYNLTDLADARLLALCRAGLTGWAVGTIRLYVRYSRSADFSGRCYYNERRIHVNIGRHVRYPYPLHTHAARSRTAGRYWWKPACILEVEDAYQLAVFVFMHELYHLLVKRARRNMRRKESMCDRFAARFLVDRFGLPMRGRDGRCLPRPEWDFQDVDAFVAAARGRCTVRASPRRSAPGPAEGTERQLLLFPVCSPSPAG